MSGWVVDVDKDKRESINEPLRMYGLFMISMLAGMICQYLLKLIKHQLLTYK